MTHPSSAFISDIPADQASQAWRRRAPRRDARPESPRARCRSPKRSAASPPSRCGRCVRPPRSTPPGWTASPCGPPRPSAPARPHRCSLRRLRGRRHRRPASDGLRRRRDARARAPHSGRARRAARRGAALPARSLDRRGHQRLRTAVARWPPAAPRRHRGLRRRRASSSCVVRRAPKWSIIPTGDEIRPVGTALAPGEIADTNSMMLAAQAAEVGCETRTTGIVADDPELIAAAVREAAVDADLVILIAGSSAGRDDYTARVVARQARSPCTGRRAPGSPGRAGHRRRRRPPRSSEPPATPSRPR